MSLATLALYDHPPALASSPPEGPITWQSAGDSYSSGEGVYGNQGACAQSDQAYGPVASRLMTADDGWQLGSMTFTACTGHLVEDYFNERADSGLKNSLWDWGRNQGGPPRVDVITMSFGGNDIGFESIIKDCLLGVPDHWSTDVVTGVVGSLSGCDDSIDDLEGRVDHLLDPTRQCAGSRHLGTDGYECDLDLGSRRGSIIDFYYDIVTQRLTDRGQLYIVGYPRLFAPVSQWPGWLQVTCGAVSRGDTEKMNALADHLNAKLLEAVGRVNQVFGSDRVHYLDRLAIFRDGHHELCGDGDDWLNGGSVNRDVGATLRYQGSFHPTAAGHADVGRALAELVDETFPRQPPIQADPGPPQLTDCEGVDFTPLFDVGVFVGLEETTCSSPWALASFSEADPSLSVALIRFENGISTVVEKWGDLEDGDNAAYTPASIAEHGVPLDVATAMYDELGGSSAGNSEGYRPEAKRSVLVVGDEGTDVHALQSMLVSVGVLAEAPDGHFGGRTEAAVRAFQTQANLEADGRAGPDTMHALDAATGGHGYASMGEASVAVLTVLNTRAGAPTTGWLALDLAPSAEVAAGFGTWEGGEPQDDPPQLNMTLVGEEGVVSILVVDFAMRDGQYWYAGINSLTGH